MKKLELTAYGNTTASLVDALEHAIQQLRLGTPSANEPSVNGLSLSLTPRQSRPKS